ncbi:MAG: trigger factor [Phycisphaeraceae bacterium]|nr:trigger factor [Phycisphaeraceae bacterium]
MAQQTAEETLPKNKVTIEDLGPCARKLSIEIPAEAVDQTLGASIEGLIADAELPGFRKGRAPRRLIERKFAPAIRKEAKNRLIGTAFQRAIDENGLKVVGDPIADENLVKAEVEPGKPLAFEVQVEVMPSFELPAMDGIDVKRPKLEATDDMVVREVSRLQLNEGALKSKEKPEAGDYLTGHAVMTDDAGKQHLDIMDAVVQIPTKDGDGKGMILGVQVEDFAKQLGTPKIGQTVTIKTIGPENHENEELRGAKLTISFEVKRSDEIVPASIDELVSRYGLESEQALRDAVRTQIAQRLGVEQSALMRQQIAKYLVENTKMELPQRLTANQAQRNLDRARLELMHRGLDAQKVEERIAQLRSSSAGRAVAELQLYFILDRVAELAGVKVTEADINNRIAQLAFSRGERPERLRQEIIQRNQVGLIFQQVREHRAMDQILSKAKIEDVTVEAFNKMFGPGGPEASEAGGGESAAKSAPKKKTAAKKDEDDAPAPAAKADKPKTTRSKKKSDE